jgi:uncharacterized membrane protein YgcG
MFRLPRFVALAALACGLLGVGTAFAVFPPPIKDEGKFFSKEALEKADKKIRSIYEKYKKDVIVETATALTAEQSRKMDEDGKNKYFARMANERSKGVGLNGVYVLIFKKPQHLQIHMDPDTQKKMFTAANRKTLTEKLVAKFKDDEFDAGLADGLDAIEAAFKANSASK